MKINKKGWELYNEWERRYYAENDRLGGDSKNREFVEGWSIIDNQPETLTDICGLMLFGYDNDAPATVDEWGAEWGENNPIWNGYTPAEIRRKLLQYFDTEVK